MIDRAHRDNVVTLLTLQKSSMLYVHANNVACMRNESIFQTAPLFNSYPRIYNMNETVDVP